MDDYKKIRAGKHKHKGRYKDPTKIVAKEASTSTKDVKVEDQIIIQDDKTFSRRGLVNNWDRYEQNIDELAISDEDISSKDFKLLADAPISKANYFQFKQDKHFLPSIDVKVEVDQLFNVDLSLISKAVSTIPLYELIGIEKSIFSDTKIENMEKIAINNLEAYNKYLDTYNKTESHYINVVPIVRKNTPDIVEKIVQKETEKKEVENLEEWLDDFLN